MGFAADLRGLSLYVHGGEQRNDEDAIADSCSGLQVTVCPLVAELPV